MKWETVFAADGVLESNGKLRVVVGGSGLPQLHCDLPAKADEAFPKRVEDNPSIGAEQVVSPVDYVPTLGGITVRE